MRALQQFTGGGKQVTNREPIANQVAERAHKRAKTEEHLNNQI